MNIKKRILSSILALTLTLFSTVFFNSCEARYKQRSVTLFDYFNTFSTLTAYSESEKDFEKYQNIFKDILSEYHNLLDSSNSIDDTVNLHYLNEHAAISPVKVSNELLDFLLFAKETHSLTNGYTSIALGSLTSLWKDAIAASNNGSAYIPSENKLNEAITHTDINDIHINEDTLEVSFTDAELRLDAGALAKGYVSKILYERLIDAGCESFLINLGGNITAHGLKNDSSPWLSGIENPTDSKYISNISIEISDLSISTSGSYNQFFMLDEVRYHHIINPYTAYPENKFVSISVVTENIAVADALSTALFSMSKESGMELVEALDKTEAIWITPDGEYFSTDGFDNYIHN